MTFICRIHKCEMFIIIIICRTPKQVMISAATILFHIRDLPTPGSTVTARAAQARYRLPETTANVVSAWPTIPKLPVSPYSNVLC